MNNKIEIDISLLIAPLISKEFKKNLIEAFQNQNDINKIFVENYSNILKEISKNLTEVKKNLTKNIQLPKIDFSKFNENYKFPNIEFPKNLIINSQSIINNLSKIISVEVNNEVSDSDIKRIITNKKRTVNDLKNLLDIVDEESNKEISILNKKFNLNEDENRKINSILTDSNNELIDIDFSPKIKEYFTQLLNYFVKNLNLKKILCILLTFYNLFADSLQIYDHFNVESTTTIINNYYQLPSQIIYDFYVRVEKANIRTEPNEISTIISKIYLNSKVKKILIKGNWYLIEFKEIKDGFEVVSSGWIYKNNLKKIRNID